MQFSFRSRRNPGWESCKNDTKQYAMKKIVNRIRNLWRFPSWLYRTRATHFPDAASLTLRVLARLHAVRNELRERNISYNLGALYTLPHPLAVKTYASFLGQNPNHLGHWAGRPPQEGATIQLEYEVIRAMIDLYRANGKNLTGYITSGATEGNIFSVWLGKSYLSEFSPPEKIRLLMTSLTHYSVRKAADICGIQSDTIGINKTTWAMAPESLLRTTRRVYKLGITGVLLPLTLGYTSTGTSDEIGAMVRIVNQLQKELPRLRIFVWIDAATQGLVTPFLSDFQPFRYPNIQTVVVDFHKYGRVPYAAGVILYKRSLQHLIEHPIDYLHETDATLSGSRPGASAASIWSMIHIMGKQGYRRIINTQMNNKTYFIRELMRVLPETEIITGEDSVSCGILFHSLPGGRLPKHIEEKYWFHAGVSSVLFYPDGYKNLILYKCFFLPHMTKKIIAEFIRDLEKSSGQP